jgi:heme A synthase
MKTSLKFLALLFAASVPAAIAAELAGVPLPVTFSLAHAFSAFVITLAALTAVADYARRPKPLVPAAARRPAPATLDRAPSLAHHPLAA